VGYVNFLEGTSKQTPQRPQGHNNSKIPKDWDQLALRFRLMHPSKLEMDHWDRVGSMGVPHGLFLEKSGGEKRHGETTMQHHLR